MPSPSPSALPSGMVGSTFVTGLQNAHAVEQQALSLIDRQLDRLVRYPDIAARLRLHRAETEQQMTRLDEIMDSLGARPSSLKDMALGFLGNLAALGHVMAPDEVLKNHFVNYAFEHYEIASYTALIALAEAGGFAAARPLLETSLREEQAMAAWVAGTLPDLTRQYVGLRAEGLPADR